MVVVSRGTDFIEHMAAAESDVIACGSFERKFELNDRKEHSFYENNVVAMKVERYSQVFMKQPFNAPIPGRNY